MMVSVCCFGVACGICLVLASGFWFWHLLVCWCGLGVVFFGFSVFSCFLWVDII